ncbi:hypothetical protein D3C85_1434180 [compost metagenome]
MSQKIKVMGPNVEIRAKKACRRGIAGEAGTVSYRLYVLAHPCARCTVRRAIPAHRGVLQRTRQARIIACIAELTDNLRGDAALSRAV